MLSMRQAKLSLTAYKSKNLGAFHEIARLTQLARVSDLFVPLLSHIFFRTLLITTQLIWTSGVRAPHRALHIFYFFLSSTSSLFYFIYPLGIIYPLVSHIRGSLCIAPVLVIKADPLRLGKLCHPSSPGTECLMLCQWIPLEMSENNSTGYFSRWPCPVGCHFRCRS